MMRAANRLAVSGSRWTRHWICWQTSKTYAQPSSSQIGLLRSSSLRLRSACSAIDLASTTRKETLMSVKPLRAKEAARQLGISTRELVRLVYHRQIRFVMVRGIAHIPEDAL